MDFLKNIFGSGSNIFGAGSTIDTEAYKQAGLLNQADVDKADALNRIVIGSRAIGFRDSTVVIGDSLTIQRTYLHGDINISRAYVLPKTLFLNHQFSIHYLYYHPLLV